MAYGKVNVGGGTGGGIGTTMIISESHKGTTAPVSKNIQLGYYQRIVAGTSFSTISLKKGATVIPTTKGIVYGGILNLNGFELLPKTEYTVEIPANAMKDVLGKVLVGAYKSTFTTGTLPVYYVTPIITKAAFNIIIADINANGGTVYFSEGEFRGLFPIKITHSDVNLIGQGNNTIIICDTPKTVNDGVIWATGTSSVAIERVTISNMVIDGDRNSPTASVDRRYDAVIFTWANNCIVKNCIMQNCVNNGIVIKQLKSFLCTGNLLFNCSGGILLSTDATSCIISNNVSQNNNAGITSHTRCNNNTICGNTCQNNAFDGIHWTAGSLNSIIGNTCTNNGRDGILNTAGCELNTISGNACQNNLRIGIHSWNSSFNTISGNTCFRNTNDGISINGDSGGGYSNYNIILANKSTNIRIANGTGNKASQNIGSQAP